MSLAQIPELHGALISSGVAGVVLLWFMFRAETRFKGVERSVNRMSKSVLLLVVSMDSANHSTKEEARNLLRELDLDKTAEASRRDDG
jgi:hypothetical protein